MCFIFRVCRGCNLDSRLFLSLSDHEYEKNKFSAYSPDEPFHNLELYNPKHGVLELYKIRRSTDYKAQKLGKGLSGCTTFRFTSKARVDNARTCMRVLSDLIGGGNGQLNP